MEPQIDTGASRGTGFDVPAQGLHLRDPEEDGTRRGVLDTSAGPVPIRMPSDDGGVEVVVGVPEQFVTMSPADGGLVGTLAIGDGALPVRDVEGVITIGG